MPIKRLSGSTTNQDLGPVARTIGGGLSGLAQNAQSLAGHVFRYAMPGWGSAGGELLDLLPNIAQTGRRVGGVTEEQLNPRGFREEVAQGVLSQGPLAALTGGGGVVNALGRTAAGVTAGAAAKHLGAGKLAQGAIQLGTELFAPGLYNKAKSLTEKGYKISKIAKELHPAQQLKRSLYDQAQSSLRPNERGSIKAWEPIKDAIRKFNRVETDDAVKNVVNKAMENIEGNFSQTTKDANISDVWGSLKALNKQISSLPSKSGARPHLEQAAGGLSNILKDYRPFNEPFWKFRTDANKIHTIQQWAPLFSQMGETLTSKGSLLGKFKWPFEKFLKAIGEGQRMLGYIKVPAARHYLGKAIHQELNSHPSAAANSLLKFLKENEKTDKGKPSGPKRISGKTIS
jgi:hypothetical protein